MKIIATPFIKLYQFFSSSTSPRCKYYPTCSNYALTAIKRHGAKGVVKATWRILRCNPFTKGGVDEVKPGSSWFKVLDNGFVVPKPKKG